MQYFFTPLSESVLHSATVARLSEWMHLLVLPYIFENKDHAYRMLEGDIGKEFASALHEAIGVNLLTYDFIGDHDLYGNLVA